MAHEAEYQPRNLGWQTLVTQLDQLLETTTCGEMDWINALLDFRFALKEGFSPKKLAELYCELRRTGEKYHYLDLFRMRRFLSRMIELVVTPGRGYAGAVVLTDLRASSVEKMEAEALNLYIEDNPEWKSLTRNFRITWKWKSSGSAVDSEVLI